MGLHDTSSNGAEVRRRAPLWACHRRGHRPPRSLCFVIAGRHKVARKLPMLNRAARIERKLCSTELAPASLTRSSRWWSQGAAKCTHTSVLASAQWICLTGVPSANLNQQPEDRPTGSCWVSQRQSNSKRTH